MIVTMGKTQVGTTLVKQPSKLKPATGTATAARPTTGQLIGQWFGQQGQQLGAQTVQATGDRIAHEIRGGAPSSAAGGAGGVVVVQGGGVPSWLAPVAIGGVALVAIAIVASRPRKTKEAAAS